MTDASNDCFYCFTSVVKFLLKKTGFVLSGVILPETRFNYYIKCKIMLKTYNEFLDIVRYIYI